MLVALTQVNRLGPAHRDGDAFAVLFTAASDRPVLG
jgi:hypothetical protein